MKRFLTFCCALLGFGATAMAEPATVTVTTTCQVSLDEGSATVSDIIDAATSALKTEADDENAVLTSVVVNDTNVTAISYTVTETNVDDLTSYLGSGDDTVITAESGETVKAIVAYDANGEALATYSSAFTSGSTTIGDLKTDMNIEPYEEGYVVATEPIATISNFESYYEVSFDDVEGYDYIRLDATASSNFTSATWGVVSSDETNVTGNTVGSAFACSTGETTASVVLSIADLKKDSKLESSDVFYLAFWETNLETVTITGLSTISSLVVENASEAIAVTLSTTTEVKLTDNLLALGLDGAIVLDFTLSSDNTVTFTATGTKIEATPTDITEFTSLTLEVNNGIEVTDAYLTYNPTDYVFDLDTESSSGYDSNSSGTPSYNENIISFADCGAWSGCGWGWWTGGFDASAYSAIEVVCTSTADVQFIVEGTATPSKFSGNAYGSYTTVSDSETFTLTVSLEECSEPLSQMYFQNSVAEQTITVESITFIAKETATVSLLDEDDNLVEDIATVISELTGEGVDAESIAIVVEIDATEKDAVEGYDDVVLTGNYGELSSMEVVADAGTYETAVVTFTYNAEEATFEVTVKDTTPVPDGWTLITEDFDTEPGIASDTNNWIVLNQSDLAKYTYICLAVTVDLEATYTNFGALLTDGSWNSEYKNSDYYDQTEGGNFDNYEEAETVYLVFSVADLDAACYIIETYPFVFWDNVLTVSVYASADYDGNIGTFYATTEGSVETAIEEVKSDVEAIEVARYNLMGQKISGEQKGINIIVYSDGSAKKVLVK